MFWYIYICIQYEIILTRFLRVLLVNYTFSIELESDWWYVGLDWIGGAKSKETRYHMLK